MKFWFLILFFFLVACTTQETRNVPVEINTKIICSDVPKADPVVMREVLPTVIEDSNDNVWVAFTSQSYENMSLNIQEVLVHLRQKNAIIYYYKRCIEDAIIDSVDKDSSR